MIITSPKTWMTALSDRVILAGLVYPQCQRVTDGQTDGVTDGRTDGL